MNKEMSEQTKSATPYRYPCAKCDKDAMISEVKIADDGSHVVKAEHIDKTIEDHTWNEYGLDVVGLGRNKNKNKN